MVTKGLWVPLEAKPDKVAEVRAFLEGGRALVDAEPDTTAWFAVQSGPTSFAIFDVFPDENGRQAHLTGELAKVLMAKWSELLSKAPAIEKIDVLAAKLRE